METGIRAKLAVVWHTEGSMKGDLEDWWIEDESGNRWEIFSNEPPNFSVQFDNGKDCGTGQFVLEPGQDLSHGPELPGVLYETPVGEFGVACEVEFPSVSGAEKMNDAQIPSKAG